MRCVPWLIIVALAAVPAKPAVAGPWGRLPDAVASLQADAGDQAAQSVVREAEASILREARSGRLAAVVVLMETYASLVMQLDTGEARLLGLESRAAAALVEWGREQRLSDPLAAATGWSLAARFDPNGPATSLLREMLLPPPEPTDGQVWTAAVDGATLVYLPPSRVRVGCSDGDRRCRENEIYFKWVEVDGFWIETTEVSNDRYRQCVRAGQCAPPVDDLRFNERGRGAEPVVGVTWRQVRGYSRWTGRRLPTEAEWERAARSGDSRWRFPWGNRRASDLANVWDEIEQRGLGVKAVASFPATGPGLFDLSGNVWEWCEDRYQTGFKDLPPDGSPMRNGVGRVVRGGSWRRGIDLARVSSRSWFEEDYWADDVGFRGAVARTEEIGESQVRSIADRAFPIRLEPGRELVGADLSAEDRRYLERRALTWLVLEERAGDAALQAAALLKRDSRDQVAIDLLDWVEEKLVEEASAGNIMAVVELQSGYQNAVAGNPAFDSRRRATTDALVAALRDCGEANARAGDPGVAEACFTKGLEIAPGNPDLRRGLSSLEHSPGDTRLWPADGKVMVWVPGGTYRFGASEGDRQADLDEMPPVTVTVKGFWIDRTEVTNAEYRKCVDAGACTPPLEMETFDDPARAAYPVLQVSWFQAYDYAKWAGKRLPSEVEWEWAARAGSPERFPWGDKWDPAYGNAYDTEAPDRRGEEMRVASFPTNPWGIHDLIGNSAEWVRDVYSPNHLGVSPDGSAREQETGPISEQQRVVRGGSYADSPSKQRVSQRSGRKPTEDHRTIGFRCVAD
jgi:sulfatase modifying factor 1